MKLIKKITILLFILDLLFAQGEKVINVEDLIRSIFKKEKRKSAIKVDTVFVGLIETFCDSDTCKYGLVPLLVYENGEYRSLEKDLSVIYEEGEAKFKYPEKAKLISNRFQKNKFFIYHKNEVVGEFQPIGEMVTDLVKELFGMESQTSPVGFPGEVCWKTKRSHESFYFIALSKNIPQPKPSFTSEQLQELEGKEEASLYPIDIDGDGITELIMGKSLEDEEGQEYYLYKLEKGRLKKIIYIGIF